MAELARNEAPIINIFEHEGVAPSGSEGRNKRTTFNALYRTFDITEKAEQISTENLYPVKEALSPHLSTVLRLVPEARGRVDQALNELKAGDKIASDDSVQHLLAILPELFCCRDIGEGFAAIINAIFNSFQNPVDKYLNKDCLLKIRKALKRLETEPYLEFIEAVDIITDMEDAGLTVDPEHMEYLADILLDE